MVEVRGNTWNAALPIWTTPASFGFARKAAVSIVEFRNLVFGIFVAVIVVQVALLAVFITGLRGGCGCLLLVVNPISNKLFQLTSQVRLRPRVHGWLFLVDVEKGGITDFSLWVTEYKPCTTTCSGGCWDWRNYSAEEA